MSGHIPQEPVRLGVWFGQFDTSNQRLEGDVETSSSLAEFLCATHDATSTIIDRFFSSRWALPFAWLSATLPCYGDPPLRHGHRGPSAFRRRGRLPSEELRGVPQLLCPSGETRPY